MTAPITDCGTPHDHYFLPERTVIMNTGITTEEEYFIRAYILPNRRERMRFELSSMKRRSDCIWRFAHCARDMLKLEYIHPVFSKEETCG